jgi:hypothetical protein
MTGYIGQFRRPCFAALNPYNNRPRPPAVDGFTLIGAWPSIAIWQRACIDCGASFQVTTPSEVSPDDPAFEITSCEEHRKRGGARELP